MTYVHISSHPAEESCLFQVTSIDGAPAPEGCEGAWQRYVITQGSNTIVGMRAGSRSDVSKILEDYVQRLNQRFAKQRLKSAS